MSYLRIGGLASGMDIDSLVEEMMRAHRIPLQRLEQEKQILEWKQEDYREINSALLSFRDLAFDMKLQSTYLAKKATSSNENVLKATAKTSAIEGTYAISVQSLAAPAYITGSEMGSSADKTTLATQLGISGSQDLQIEYQYLDESGNTVTVSNTFTVDTDNESIYDLINKINNYEPASGEWNVKASYDENLDRLFLMTTESGADQTITVTDNDALSDYLGLTPSASTANISDSGQNAQYTLNGVALESTTNTFTVNDITFDLKGTSASEVYVTVSNDTEAVFDSIVKFIDEYNKVIEKISGELYEERYPDYQPLTDEQREQLTDDQIERWIEKARSGLLRGDSILYGIYNKMRLTMSTVVPTGEDLDRLADIGITTTSNYMSPKLVVDEDKLREAIESNPEGVMGLFSHSSDNYSEMGIAKRLYEDVVYGMKRLSEKAGSENDYSLVDNSLIGKEIERLEEEIERKEEYLSRLEDRYWNEFVAMEKAIQQMNQQSMWLAQQLGLGGTA